MSKSKEYMAMYNDLNWKEKLSYFSEFFWLFFDAMPRPWKVSDYYLETKYPKPIKLVSCDESDILEIKFDNSLLGVESEFKISNKSKNFQYCMDLTPHVEALTCVNENLTYESEKVRFKTRLLTPSVSDKEECQWEWTFINKYGISSSFIVTNKLRNEIYDRYTEYQNLEQYHDYEYGQTYDPIELCLKLGISYRDVIIYWKNERLKYEKDS